MRNTKVKDLMTQHPVFINADATLQEAAEKMKTVDCGVLPVGTPKHIEGVITDRDLVIRAMSKGKDPAKEKISAYITKHVYACNEDDVLEDAADKMRTHKISRLVVRNKQGDVTGVLSFGGILRRNANADEVTNVVKHAVAVPSAEGCAIFPAKKKSAK